LRRPDARIVVEFEPQARIEGEIQQLDAAARVIELADIVSGKLPGRLAPAEVSIFDSVGFALNDFSSLRYLHRLEGEYGGGSVIDLIPRLDDPKDLFGELKLGRPMAVPGAARGGIPA
jgi:ornithine cyclodeaminase